MARVYASAIFCTTEFRIAVDRLRLIAGDRGTPAWAAHVERAYRCALAFCFNDYYRKPIRVRHLLSSRFDLSEPIGEVWCDWTLLTNTRLGTDSLHLDFCFPSLELDPENPACPATEAVAAFLARLYELTEREQALPGGLIELSRVLCAIAQRRHNALGVSRYIFVSLTSERAGPVSAPSDDVRTNFYRLLYQHARGVDTAVACKMLPEPWGSASFFRLYSQPGGMLSVSVPYPDDELQVRLEYADWFAPRPPGIGEPPPAALDAVAERNEPPRYANYDHLPEFPPLRYLAMPVIVYVAAFEETLREVHEAAFGRRGVWRLRWPWQPKPAARHLLAANLEGLRLPIMRDLANRLLEKQLQQRTAGTSMEMLRIRESARNLLISVVIIVLTIVFGDFRVVGDKVKSVAPGGAGQGAAQEPAGAGPADRSR
jgi:hypothetical protein